MAECGGGRDGSRAEACLRGGGLQGAFTMERHTGRENEGEGEKERQRQTDRKGKIERET